MRCPLTISHKRRVLCVFPAYTPSFGTFAHALRLMYRVDAFMPPQGLLLIAAYLPEAWQVRFIDENVAAADQACGYESGTRRKPVSQVSNCLVKNAPAIQIKRAQ